MKSETKKIQPRVLIGEVVSDKMMKTRVVAVHRTKRHPKYGKFFRVTKKFKAHDEENTYHTGDKVKIRESKPLSKDKRWTIIEKITI
ncbi:MAG: 30S ribosomal protein S17 [Anaplasmataceae bacterium]|nr:30S ribosomal protein S17 [Anaplasmataceae bacterium]